MRCLLTKKHRRVHPFPRLPWRQLFQLAIVAFGVLAISTNLPASAQTIEPSAVIIALPSDEEFYINKVKVPREGIAAAVYILLRDLPEEKRVIYIKAAADVKYGTVVGLVNELKDRGYSIGLVADKKKQPDANADARRRNQSDNQPSQGVEVPASEGSETSEAGESEKLTVTVRLGRGSKMQVRVGSKPVALHQLTSVVRANLKSRAVKNVRVVAPASSSYGAIVEIIDSIKSGGGGPIELHINQ